MNPSILIRQKSTHSAPVHSSSVILLFNKYTEKDIPQPYQKYFSALQEENFKGNNEENTSFHDGSEQITFIGFGNTSEFQITELQEHLGNYFRKASKKFKTIIVHAYALEAFVSPAALVKELTLIADLSTYKFTKYKSPKVTDVKPFHKEIILLLSETSESLEKVKEDALILSEGVKYTRDICNEPPNVATPMYLAYHMKADSADTPYTVEIFDEKKIQEMGMNLVYAVGKGSTKPSFFTKISYFGDASTKSFRALVGKGVAFDAGGVQVKPDFSMCTMKTDMSGAAAVMGTLHTIAKLELKINVVGYLPFVQNMPDGNAYCPDDVYTAFNGKTVEIIHTDAEGRLVLADALAFASHEKPLEIIDLATLTGAALVSFGTTYGAIMGTGEELKQDLIALGDKNNELLWPLPFHKDYKKMIKSDIADLKNLAQNRLAGTIVGGIFLREFVDNSIPWVHLDIAGVTHTTEESGIKAGNCTGFGVRTLVEYFMSKQ